MTKRTLSVFRSVVLAWQQYRKAQDDWYLTLPQRFGYFLKFLVCVILGRYGDFNRDDALVLAVHNYHPYPMDYGGSWDEIVVAMPWHVWKWSEASDGT